VATIRRFYDLEAWKKARTLNVEIYKITNTEFFKKDFILIDQCRRAAVSVMANIAEGFGRKGNKEFLQFISLSQGSLTELQSHLFIALDLNYIHKEIFDKLFALTEEVHRILNGLSEYLKSSYMKGAKYKLQTNEPINS
jgi:four helix bundle protein